MLVSGLHADFTVELVIVRVTFMFGWLHLVWSCWNVKLVTLLFVCVGVWVCVLCVCCEDLRDHRAVKKKKL